MQRKYENTRTSDSMMYDKAHTQHQYEDLVLVGEITHSTDQPEGKAVTPANTSSKVISENKATSKAEYTNTQQGLPVSGYTLVR